MLSIVPPTDANDRFKISLSSLIVVSRSSMLDSSMMRSVVPCCGKFARLLITLASAPSD